MNEPHPCLQDGGQVMERRVCESSQIIQDRSDDRLGSACPDPDLVLSEEDRAEEIFKPHFRPLYKDVDEVSRMTFIEYVTKKVPE